jgi:exosortase
VAIVREEAMARVSQVTQASDLSPAGRTALVWRGVLLAAFCAAVAMANQDVLRALINLSRNDASSSHVVVIPFVTVALIYQGRQAIFTSIRTDWAAGLGVMLAGVAVALAARASSFPAIAHSLSAAVAGVVLLWIAGFLVCYGRDAARAALFPLLFLGFTIPIPAPVLDGAIRFLKRGSTEMVDALFSLTGTVYHRDGFVFTLPTVAIEIADECSGIRSSIALLLTTLLAGYTFLSTGWKKAVLVAAIVPLTILKNGIRIVGLTLLAVHVNPSFLSGQLHHEGGIVFFLMALLLLEPLFRLLRKSEPEYRRSRNLAHQSMSPGAF